MFLYFLSVFGVFSHWVSIILTHLECNVLKSTGALSYMMTKYVDTPVTLPIILIAIEAR